MTIIKKSSWHYKMVNKYFPEPSSSLCIYFWQCVASIAAVFSMLVFFALVFVALVAAPILSVTFFVYPPFTEYAASLNETSYIPGLIVIGSIVIIVGTALVLSIGSVRLFKHILHKIQSKSPTASEKRPGLISEYIRAKKDRVCPTITFVKDE